jgi:hypothetical protein
MGKKFVLSAPTQHFLLFHKSVLKEDKEEEENFCCYDIWACEPTWRKNFCELLGVAVIMLSHFWHRECVAAAYGILSL